MTMIIDKALAVISILTLFGGAIAMVLSSLGAIPQKWKRDGLVLLIGGAIAFIAARLL